MKRNFFLMGTLILFVVSGIFWSCQKEEIMNPEDGFMKKGKVVAMESTNDLTWEAGVCAGEEHQFCLEFPQDYLPNGNTTNTNVNVQIWNPELGDEGDWEQIFQGNFGSGPQCFDYEFPEAGTYILQYKIGGGGFSEKSVEVKNCFCSYEMTGAVVCDGFNRTATFTYTPEEDGWLKIQGGLTRWATNVEYEFSGYENLNSNASVGGWEGPVSACTEYTFIVNWEYVKTNGQNERTSEDGNVIGDWTAELLDAKNGNLIKLLVVDEMLCGDALYGYDPNEVVE